MLFILICIIVRLNHNVIKLLILIDARNGLNVSIGIFDCNRLFVTIIAHTATIERYSKVLIALDTEEIIGITIGRKSRIHTRESLDIGDCCMPLTTNYARIKKLYSTYDYEPFVRLCRLAF